MEPEPPRRSRAHEIATLFAAWGYASIPVVGPPLSAGLTRWMDGHYGRRLDAFLQQVAELLADARNRVDDLEARHPRPEEEVVSAVGIALSIAARTHQSEKLKALATAIKTTVMGRKDVPFDDVATFLRLVTNSTPCTSAFFGMPNTLIA